MIECIDKFTGEVVKQDYASNRFIPVPDYSVNNEPSMTVPDQVEPIEITVSRCLRGELLDIGKKPVYEFDSNVNIDDINFNDLESPGADLADIESVVSSVASKAGEGTSAKADVGATAVAQETTDNSESTTKSADSSEPK